VVHTDTGAVGTGETMPRVAAVERVVHEVLAPLLLGGDASPERFWQAAFRALAYHGYAGAELRALSALDIALWDLVGQAAGLPVHRLLGGPCRTVVPVYNTCVSHGPIRDHERFLDDPAGLARELAGEGYTAMKIWPFDELSTSSRGHRVERRALLDACRVFAAIRDAVGDGIEVALEGHSCWDLPAAVEIARAVEEFSPMWLEDMLHAGDAGAWRSLHDATATPICGSERLFTRYGLAPFLRAGALDIVKQDLCWTGGFTEFVKVCALAGAHELPVAPHNCHGPVGAMATLHASAAIPNLRIMESVRAFTRGFFADLVDEPPHIEGAGATVPERPGLGLRLRDDVVARARRTVSTADSGVAASGWGEGDPWRGGKGDRV
jgi:L-alanine-DL-glutamate epimerase-like enolase superfamily enzyme